MPIEKMQGQHNFWPLNCAHNVSANVNTYVWSEYKMDLTVVLLPADTQNWHDYNAFNFLNQQRNVNRLTCHIVMKVVSEDSFYSVVWWGARASFAEVSTGSVESSKARLGFRSHMDPEVYRRIHYLRRVRHGIRLHIRHPLTLHSATENKSEKSNGNKETGTPRGKPSLAKHHKSQP
jgi:hypothetical protein